VLSAGAVGAVEIAVLAGMGARCRGVRDVAPAFERATGHRVIVSFEAGPSLMQKVNAGAPADLVTHYPEVTDDLIKQGKVVGSCVDFARAGVGIAVKAGARKPDIGTPEAFKRAMLAAKSIAYSRTGASGIIAAKLMERLGIAEQLKDKTKLVGHLPLGESFNWLGSPSALTMLSGGPRRPRRRGRGRGRSRDRHAADQSHPARCRCRLRRHPQERHGAAAALTGICQGKWRKDGIAPKLGSRDRRFSIVAGRDRQRFPKCPAALCRWELHLPHPGPLVPSLPPSGCSTDAGRSRLTAGTSRQTGPRHDQED
jgi:Bacterial extracellular solute-binding protein